METGTKREKVTKQGTLRSQPACVWVWLCRFTAVGLGLSSLNSPDPQFPLLETGEDTSPVVGGLKEIVHLKGTVPGTH